MPVIRKGEHGGRSYYTAKIKMWNGRAIDNIEGETKEDLRKVFVRWKKTNKIPLNSSDYYIGDIEQHKMWYY